MSNLIFCLMGPTASGKTALASELIQLYPFEIVSVDSALVYRGMDIGTAKPTAQELLVAPHHLIDIKDPTEHYSAAQFCADVKEVCESIFKKNKIPLLTGGTMMYFNALQKGLSALPEADEHLRKQIEQEASVLGWPELYQKLKKVDPETAARIHEHDGQRIQRALEVYYIEGIAMSTLQLTKKTSCNYRFINLILFPNRRAWLHERLAQRFEQMLDEGLIEEVRGLQQLWRLKNDLPSMRCVGYRQVLEYLAGSCDYKVLKEKGIAATRQLAKRQLTWLRHWESGSYYDPEDPIFKQEMMAQITEILDNEALN